MTAFTSYSVDNDRKFRDALTAAGAQVGNLTIPFTLISRDFYRSERAIFKLQGPGQYPPFKNSGGYYRTNKRTGARKWVEHSNLGGVMSPYQVRKRKKWGFDYPLLVASGDLRDAMTDPTAKGAINIISEDGSSLTIGTDLRNDKGVMYPVFHQSDEPRSKIPLRKFLFIGPEASEFASSEQIGRLDRWLNIVNGYVVAKLGTIGTVK